MNHQALLGVEPLATASEIREAYKRKVLQYHPDKNPDADPAMFPRITNAYQALLKAAKQRELAPQLPKAAARAAPTTAQAGARAPPETPCTPATARANVARQFPQRSSSSPGPAPSAFEG